MNTTADPTNTSYIQNGVNAVFWVAAIVSAVGLVIVLLVIKPQMSKKTEL